MHETLLASLRTDPIFYCRLRGSEGFRQQLLRRKGKLVLLTPSRAGAGVQEVAHYLKLMLTNCSRQFSGCLPHISHAHPLLRASDSPMYIVWRPCKL